MSYWGILTGLASPDSGTPAVTSDVVYEVRAVNSATGTLVTGLAPSFTFFVGPDGIPVSQPTISEVGGMGVYQFTYAPAIDVSFRIDLDPQGRTMAAGDRYVDGVCSTNDSSGIIGYYLRRIFGWMFWRKDVDAASKIITYYDGDGAAIGTQTVTGDNNSTVTIGKEVAS